MARGNEIIVSANPLGHFTEGYIGSGLTPKPGTILQRQTATALRGGRWTYELYNADADGGRPKGAFYVLLPDHLQGRLATDAYAAGERCFLYTPLAGDELNLLVKNETGTADDHPLGEMLVVDDTTGLLVVSPGSGEETEVAQLLEAITDPTADTLAWVEWTGH